MNTLLLGSHTDINYLTDENGEIITNDGVPITVSVKTFDWDLMLDAAGNLAVATGHYAIAQDVASAVRTFLGELWYDTTFGIPYLEQIFGQRPSLQFLKAQFIGAGMTVPGVASIACFLTGPGPSREVGGQMQITNDVDNLVTVIESTTILQPGVIPWYVTSVGPEDLG